MKDPLLEAIDALLDGLDGRPRRMKRPPAKSVKPPPASWLHRLLVKLGWHRPG
jgi:hypothetical protein